MLKKNDNQTMWTIHANGKRIENFYKDPYDCLEKWRKLRNEFMQAEEKGKISYLYFTHWAMVVVPNTGDNPQLYTFEKI